MYNCISSVPINRHSEFIKFTYQVISSHSGMTVQSRTIWKLLLTLFVTKRYKTETIWKTHSLAGFHPPFWIRKTSYNEKSQTLQFWKEHPPFISLPLPATLVGKTVSTSCLKMKLLPPPNLPILNSLWEVSAEASCVRFSGWGTASSMWHTLALLLRRQNWSLGHSWSQRTNANKTKQRGQRHHQQQQQQVQILLLFQTGKLINQAGIVNLLLLGEPILCILPRCILCICWGCLQVSCFDVFCMFLLPF